MFYSLAEFSFPPVGALANESIEPVHKDFAGWSSPETKPTSLILGLGYEPDEAEGASEYFEPSDQWLFIPKSPERSFYDAVNLNNRNLLEKTDSGRRIEYSVMDPETTYGQLEMVISFLSSRSNPVLLPFGPKIFFFLCLVHCISHPEIGVWRVSRNKPASESDVVSSGHVTSMRLVLGR